MIKIISVGKIKDKELDILINKYLKMIPRKVELISVKDEATKDKMDLEAERILKNVKPEDYVVTLEIFGTMLDSPGLAKFINDVEANIQNDIIFIIGGSYGLSNKVKERSNYQLSFSKFTFPHQLMLLILIEQVYRAYMINSNHPYHK